MQDQLERCESPIDCAVGTFAKTFSTTRGRQRPTPVISRGRQTSRNLPVELLLIIFALVYEDEDIDWDDRTTSQLMSPTLFPYSTASVCALWRDAMSHVPQYWNRIVILIDTPATPLSAIVSQLEWSRDCDLKIIVTQRDLDSTVKDPNERSNMISIMNILGSHMHRIHDLSFDVVFSSSLPSFPTDFCGTATILQNLHLGCRKDDGGPDLSVWVAPTRFEDFKCPALRTLVIDGRNYYEACKKDAWWTDKIATIYSLTIAHFNPRPGESFSSHELLKPLKDTVELAFFHITDLALRPSHDHFYLSLHIQTLKDLRFEDFHDVEVIDEICMSIGKIGMLAFTRCTFRDIPDGHDVDADSADFVSFDEINQDLAPLLWRWSSDGLNLSGCPQFDDAVLDVMSCVGGRVSVCAPRTRLLEIQDCSNFSIAALRRLVESRSHLPSGFEDGYAPVPSQIQRLTMYGNVPLLSEEDRSWFEGNVQEFDYDAFQ